MSLLNRNKKHKPSSEPQKAVLTVYACRKNNEGIEEIAAEILKDSMIAKKHLPDGGIEITLQDDTTITFHIMRTAQQLNDHIMGMTNFFSKAPLENEDVKQNALRQISLFNCVVGIEFPVTDDDDRTEYLVVAVYLLAVKLHGFVLHPNMYLYCANRQLLISADGNTDLETFVPIADSNILDSDKEEEQADIDRRERSNEKCRQMGLKTAKNLRASVCESECVIPEKEEIIHRLTCVFAAAVCSEACTSCEPKEAAEMCKGMIEDLDDKYSVIQWFSNEERAYTKNPMKFSRLHPKFGWRYECCAVLLWALGLWDLPEPKEICDAGDIGKIIWNNDFNSLNETAVLKSKTEILDMQDMIFRYNWACVDAQINGGAEITTIDPEIVFEWHYALNWLTNANGTKDWDNIRTHT